jgi:hypothetical protein
MNSQQRAVLRENILVGLDVAGEFRPTVEALRVNLNRSGIQATNEEIKMEVAYLIDKGLVAAHERAISPEMTQYRITAAGRDYLAKEGLS